MSCIASGLSASTLSEMKFNWISGDGVAKYQGNFTRATIKTRMENLRNKNAGAFEIMPSQQLKTFLTLITLQSGTFGYTLGLCVCVCA